MPNFSAPLASANSPSGCASLAIAAGLMKKGIFTSWPRMLVLVSMCLMFLSNLGRNHILSNMLLFASRVTRFVAAEE